MSAPALSPRVPLGRIGVWVRTGDIDPASLASRLEELGYGALWLGGSPDPDLAVVDDALSASEHIAVATGIVAIWAAPAAALAESWHRIEQRHPGRFLLGIGTSHPERWGADAARPYAALDAYLDALEAEGVPAHRLVVAALGPRTLRLAAERTAGAHPFLVPIAHTRAARDTVGSGALLAPEQRVVREADPERARAIARPTVETPYLGLRNYRRNLHRLGYAETDLDNGGSDQLIDDLVAWGDDTAIAAHVRAQLDAGADHVCLQLLQADDDGYARLAAALELSQP